MVVPGRLACREKEVVGVGEEEAAAAEEEESYGCTLDLLNIGAGVLALLHLTSSELFFSCFF